MKRAISTITMPTDLMLTAFRQLFPAERMVIFNGRRTKLGTRVTSMTDVTEAKPSTVHVNACSQRLTRALMDCEQTGAHLAVWMHSHPGVGKGCTHPSETDLRQERDLRQHYSSDLVCVIVVRDGWLRLWGEAITSGRVAVCWLGTGIEPHPEDPHVFHLSTA